MPFRHKSRDFCASSTRGHDCANDTPADAIGANDTPADADAICTIPQFSAVHSFVMTASVFGFEFEWEAFSLLSFAITKSDAKIRISMVQYVDRVIALIINRTHTVHTEDTADNKIWRTGKRLTLDSNRRPAAIFVCSKDLHQALLAL